MGTRHQLLLVIATICIVACGEATVSTNTDATGPDNQLGDVLLNDAFQPDTASKSDTATEDSRLGDLGDSFGTPATCGNAVIEEGEECDDGDNNSNELPDSCRENCQSAFCGDGVIDASEACDDANGDETDSCTSKCEPGPKPTQPLPGQIVFTELMINPVTVSDPTGEWIEMQNVTGMTFDLSECILHDEGSDVVQLSDHGELILEPGATIVFGFEATPQLNGGAGIDVSYKTLLLDNSFDEVRLTCLDVLIDEVSYSPIFAAIEEGHALALDGTKTDAKLNDLPDSWCSSQVEFGAGDFGTPGVPNPTCPIIDVDIDHCALTSDENIIGFFGSPVALKVEVVDVGLTNQTPGIDANSALKVQVGYGPIGVSPEAISWNWTDAAGEPGWTSNKGADGYIGNVTPEAKGLYEAAARASRDGGNTWTYCDRLMGSSDGYQSQNASMVDIQANPCAEQPCSDPPDSTCADDGLTLLTYSNQAFCVPLGPQDVSCTYPIVEIFCGDEGLSCEGNQCSQKVPTPSTFGAFALTEVLLEPSSGTKEARWFEILNTTEGPLNLEGCWLSDGHDGSHLIAQPLVVAQGAFQVFAGSDDPTINGGITDAYTYKDELDLKLGGSGMAIACNGTIIDSVETSQEYILPTGTAMSLSYYKLDAELNDENYSWCLATAPFGDGDLGTPGSLNPDCPNDTVTVKNCSVVPGTGDFANAGQSLPIQIELMISEKTEGVEVVPVVEIGFGPAGTTPDSPNWTWKMATKEGDLLDMNNLDPGSGYYAAPIRLPGEGTWSIGGRGSGDDGKSSVFCDLGGSKNGFSIADCPAVLASPSPCWPDPCGAPGKNLCYENTVVNKLGEAICEVEADEALCLWTVETLKDCPVLGGSCDMGQCIGLPPQPGPGEVIFSELLIVPAADNAEWIELANLKDKDMLLGGCVLESKTEEFYIFPDIPTEELVIPAMGKLVLVREGKKPLESLEIAPTYTGVSLSYDNDSLRLRCSGAIIDELAWNENWPIVPFQTMQLSSNSLSATENDNEQSWCSLPNASPAEANSICP